MASLIYKPGQGYWTRVLSAAGIGLIIVSGAGWIYSKLSVTGDLYLQAGVAVGMIVILGLITYFVMNRKKIVDFMIATEAEMKKVHWPTWPEIRRNTFVVIAGTLILAGLLMIFDFVFGAAATAINLLES